MSKSPNLRLNIHSTQTAVLRRWESAGCFSDHAERNRIQSEPMKIGEIVQKTKVILDEDGTRAGAITSGSFMTLSEVMNPTKAYFYADHPFAYIIQDPFDSYCFMGTFWGGI